MAADRTNIKSATWIRSFVICVSLKRVGTRKAWIVTPPRALASLRGNQKACCQQISGWHPNQNLSGKVWPAHQIQAIEKNREELQRQTPEFKLQRTETATSKARALHSAFREAARIYDWAVLAGISAKLPPCTPRGNLWRIKPLVNV